MLPHLTPMIPYNFTMLCFAMHFAATLCIAALFYYFTMLEYARLFFKAPTDRAKCASTNQYYL